MFSYSNLSRISVEAWLSAPRYKRYLEAASNDDQLAIELYLWNIGLAQAVLKDISFFEVALRNTYDRVISKTWCGNEHWLFDDTSPVRRVIIRTNKRGQTNDVNRLNRSTVDRLRNNLNDDVSSDKIIPNLTLGFWTHMTDKNHERDLWIPSIHHVWPKGTSRNKLNRKIAEINNIRNRAAHHEHLFATKNTNCSTEQICIHAATLFKYLAPEIHNYIYGKESICSVTEYLKENPAPCKVSI